MNIALATTEFVSESNFDGGLANYTYKLAKWLLSKNHQVTVFLTADRNEETIFDDIRVFKVDVPDLKWKYKYRFERFGLKFLLNKKKYYALEFEANALYINAEIERKHRVNKFDIVHYPHISGLAKYCPKGLPNVVRLSSSTRLCQELGGYGNVDLAVQMQERIEILAMKKTNAIFGPSKMVASIMEKEIEKKIKIIETPYIKPSVSLDDSIYQTKLGSRKYILFFGSIGLIKGIGTIAEMIFDLLEKEQDLYFVFVGKKLSNHINGIPLWDYLVQKAKGHADRIVHLEPLKHPQLFPVIQHSACVVLPSRIDNFPNTCIEAMAQGKIVIGTQGNGFDQLIDHEKSGFIVPVDDPEALLKAILKTLHLPLAEKQAIEQTAQKRIDLLHPDIVLNELLDLYEQTIKQFS